MVHARLLVCHGVARDIAWRRKGSKCRRAYTGEQRKEETCERREERNPGSQKVLSGEAKGGKEIEAARRKPAQDW